MQNYGQYVVEQRVFWQTVHTYTNSSYLLNQIVFFLNTTWRTAGLLAKSSYMPNLLFVFFLLHLLNQIVFFLNITCCWTAGLLANISDMSNLLFVFFLWMQNDWQHVMDQQSIYVQTSYIRADSLFSVKAKWSTYCITSSLIANSSYTHNLLLTIEAFLFSLWIQESWRLVEAPLLLVCFWPKYIKDELQTVSSPVHINNWSSQHCRRFAKELISQTDHDATMDI